MNGKAESQAETKARSFPAGKALAIASTVVVVAVVAVGLSVIDGPATERAYRLDKRRVDTLNTLASKIDCYWTLEKRLPDDLAVLDRRLDELAAKRSLPTSCQATIGKDLDTGKNHVYRKGKGKGKSGAYEICATFALASRTRRRTGGYGGSKRRYWKHPAGEHCFARKPQKLKSLR